MDFSLNSELERLVQSQIQSGRYLTASEVICEALRLLEARDKLRDLNLRELRMFVAVGIEQAERGAVAVLDLDARLVEMRARKAKKREEGS